MYQFIQTKKGYWYSTFLSAINSYLYNCFSTGPLYRFKIVLSKTAALLRNSLIGVLNEFNCSVFNFPISSCVLYYCQALTGQSN